MLGLVKKFSLETNPIDESESHVKAISSAYFLKFEIDKVGLPPI